MTDNELLLAISNMLGPIKDDIQEIKNRVKKIELAQENITILKKVVTEHSEKLQKIG